MNTLRRTLLRIDACSTIAACCALILAPPSTHAQTVAIATDPARAALTQSMNDNAANDGAMPSSLTMHVGQARVFSINAPIERVAVGNGKILSVTTIQDRQILLLANDGGETTVRLWFKGGGERQFAVRVTTSNVDRLADEVKQILGDIPGLTVRPLGDNVVLTGRDIPSDQVEFIKGLTQRFPQVVSFVTSSTVPSRESTVLMQAQVIEVKKSILDDIGIQWEASMRGPSVGVIGDGGTHRYVIRPQDPPFNEEDFKRRFSPLKMYVGIASVLSSTINLLEQRGDAYTLAAPQLTARCGGKADFLSGGEYPIPLQSAFGTTVEFKQYGIKLTVEPNCDGARNIRAKVRAEVSQIDPAVTVLGVPGTINRQTESEVTLNDGQSMLLSGLASMNASEDTQRVPILGQIPLIGRLFRNENFRGERTELVVVITPRLITADSNDVAASQQRIEDIRNQLRERIQNKSKPLFEFNSSNAPKSDPDAPPTTGQ